MIRQGKYTKKVSRVTRLKRALRRRWVWYKGLSKPKKVMLIASPILAFLILTPLITYAFYYNDIADQERLMNRNNTGVVLMDKNDEAFYSTGRAERRDLVPLDQISDNVKDAVIAAEDKDFYEHSGFSIFGIMRALYGVITNQSVYGGGSTLTQQLAKNTLLTADQNFLRKYQELAISIAIEQRYSKDEILTMYLNSSYFGGNVFGIEEAAKAYFNKSPKDLDLAESAMLIGILPAPNAYSPTLGSPKYAKERQETVLERMVTNGYISEEQKQAAFTQELAYQEMSETQDSEAPHFVEMVLGELYEKYGEETVKRSGYQVRTTLDLGMQRTLAKNINEHMPFIQQNGGSNAAGVAIDPATGEVRALVGSADWNNKEWGEVNLATTARQPGSSFKPIYYSAALADGVITPATVIPDVPTDFGGYRPLNADRLYRGDVTVRTALAWSLNIPAVKVMEDYGITRSIEAANKLGITTVDENGQYGLSLALGSAEVPLIEMANAYAAFANHGQQYPTTIISQINTKYNDNIFRANETSKQAITQQGAFLISSILSDNNARAGIFGSSLTVPGRTAAVKTGTTDDQRDAWTIGYTPQLAVGVWVGNNDNAPMLNGGSGMAGPIWVNTIREALESTADTPFTEPSGIVQRFVCYAGGGIAQEAGPGTYTEYFLSTALPTATCTPVQEREPERKPEEERDTNKDKDQDTPGGNGDDSGTDEGDENGGDSGGGNGGDGDGGIVEPPVITP